MAAITSLGTGSGLALESLLKNLMTAERAPINALNARQTAVDAKISAFGKLQSSLGLLQSAAQGLKSGPTQSVLNKFALSTAVVADPAVATVSAAAGAVAGSYVLEVEALAKAHKLVSGAVAPEGVISAGGGSLTLEFGRLAGGVFTPDADRTVTLNLAAGATLQDLRSALANSGTGVSATVVRGAQGDQLVLTSQEGTESTLRLAGSGVAGFDFDPTLGAGQGWAQTQVAADARFSLDSIAITSQSNTVTGALTGITLSLTKTNVGTPTSLKVSQESGPQMKTALEGFVKAFNETRGLISTQGAYDPATKTGGQLLGNSTLRYAQTQLWQTVANTTSGVVGSPYQTLASIGISTNAKGEMSLDGARFDAALAADPDTVGKLVGKVGAAFDALTERLIGFDGSVTIAKNGLDKTAAQYEATNERLQLRLATIEARYRKQFSALDNLMSSLTQSSNALASYTSAWAKPAG